MKFREAILERTKRSLYYIAFRKLNGGGILEEKEEKYYFKKVKVKNGYWIADPILYQIAGRIFLFCEMFNTKENKGCIGIAEYLESKESFSEIKPIIEEEFHMSFPYVFTYEGHIFMIPEVGAVRQIRIYEMQNTPYEWSLYASTDTDGRISDVVSYSLRGDIFFICTEHCEDDPLTNKLVIYKAEISPTFIVSKVYETDGYDHNLRNGGPLLEFNGDMYRVIQRDDEGMYGSGLCFAKMTFDGKEYTEHMIVRKVKCSDVVINVNQFVNDMKGIHSYTKCGCLEVIDVFAEKMSLSGAYHHVVDVFTSVFRKQNKEK